MPLIFEHLHTSIRQRPKCFVCMVQICKHSRKEYLDIFLKDRDSKSSNKENSWDFLEMSLQILTLFEINISSVTQISVFIHNNDSTLYRYFTLSSSAVSDWFIGPWRMCGALCCTWDPRPGWTQSAGFMGERETEGDQIRQVNNLPLVLDFTPPACAHQKADSVNTTGAVFMKQWDVSFGCEPHGP